jgi:hypothetical protein
MGFKRLEEAHAGEIDAGRSKFALARGRVLS